jgi:hypothetical protein
VFLNKYHRRLLGLKRAIRVARIRRSIFSRVGVSNPDYFDDDGIGTLKMIHTRVPCSCPMCGNPRKHFGEVTRQEKLAEIEEE